MVPGTCRHEALRAHGREPQSLHAHRRPVERPPITELPLCVSPGPCKHSQKPPLLLAATASRNATQHGTEQPFPSCAATRGVRPARGGWWRAQLTTVTGESGDHALTQTDPPRPARSEGRPSAPSLRRPAPSPGADVRIRRSGGPASHGSRPAGDA
eukprot:scaffold2263_cov391-Prasinococcus_capsulatus_cf.AAC.12